MRICAFCGHPVGVTFMATMDGRYFHVFQNSIGYAAPKGTDSCWEESEYGTKTLKEVYGTPE